MRDAVSVVVIVFVHVHIVLAHPFISSVLSFPSTLEEDIVEEEEFDESQVDFALVAEKETGERLRSCAHAYMCICKPSPF